MELLNLDNGQTLAANVLSARTFIQRLKGLMFTKTFAAGSCLHIQPCTSIHTFFMKYPIDVLYLNDSLTIVGMEQKMAPGRVGIRVEGTVSVAELPAGTIERTDTKIGQQIQWKN